MNIASTLWESFSPLKFGRQPFASLLAGYTADSLTMPVSIWVSGLLLMLGAILFMTLRPALRRWEAGTPVSIPVVDPA